MADNYLDLQSANVLQNQTNRFEDSAAYPSGLSGETEPAIEWAMQVAFISTTSTSKLMSKTTLVDKNGTVALREVDELTKVSNHLSVSKTRLFRSTDEQAVGLHDNNQTINMLGANYTNLEFQIEMMGQTNDGIAILQIDRVTNRPSLVTPSNLSADFSKAIGDTIKDTAGGGTPAPAIDYATGTDGTLNDPRTHDGTGFCTMLSAIGPTPVGTRSSMSFGINSWVPYPYPQTTGGSKTWKSGSGIPGGYFAPLKFGVGYNGWDEFAGPEYNGSQRITFGPNGEYGYFDFNYNFQAFYNAFNGLKHPNDCCIAQDGSVWKGASVATGTMVTGPTVSFYTRIIDARWVSTGQGRQVFNGDIVRQ